MTKKQHVEYTQRHRALRNGSPWSSDVSDYVFVAPEKVYNPAKSVHEDLIETEETICSSFGCGKKLTLMESLAGNKCLNHQGGGMDITNCLSI